MEKDRPTAWDYGTENVELKHREREPDRETDRKIQRGYREQREELKTGDKEPARETRRWQGIVVGAARRGRD